MMVLRKLDERLQTCLNDLIKQVVYDSIYVSRRSNIDLLSNPKSYLNQATEIRKDLVSMADPDAIEAIGVMDAIFKDTASSVKELYSVDLRDRILFEISKLRKYIGLEKRKKKITPLPYGRQTIDR